MKTRKSGVLAHIISLPSAYGIGTLGQAAFDFINFLSDAKQTYWQILPLGVTDFGNSPYQCFSSVAGNPNLIDLDILADWGLLTREDLQTAIVPNGQDRVQYGEVITRRALLFELAFSRIHADLQLQIDTFTQASKDWLPDYALFMALRAFYGNVPLWAWPDADLKARQPEALARAKQNLQTDIAYHIFLQYAFFTQWNAVRSYASQKQIQILGDLPIYVAPDSVDVWVNPTLFKLQKSLQPNKVAGVPPDYYSATGQLWGNPVYDWQAHAAEGYTWWLWRLQKTLACYDIIRIDHFRAFADYWEVPHTAQTAIDGKWVKGPGMAFWTAAKRTLGALPIVAEDLGIITQEVRDLLKETGFPGMRVLIFGLYPEDDNEHLPHNYGKHTVAYTSTHDSQTICEHVMDIATPAQKEFAYAYLRTSSSEPMGWSAIKSVWGSAAKIAIAPMQDVLSLGADARMNIPATVGDNNWSWRFRAEAMNKDVSRMLRAITETYQRQ